MSVDLLLLLVWGVLVGVDLVSVPQMMISRPLVAGAVAGAIIGDVGSGIVIGAVLELFALEILPIGAVRYPDFGPAAVGAVYAAGAEGGWGVALVIGLLVAYVGEWSLQGLRRLNAMDVRRRAAAIDAGDPRSIRAVHLRGITRDVVRSVALTGLGLGLAAAAHRWPPVTGRAATLLAASVVGVALATAAGGAKQLTDRPRGARWFTLGLGLGIVWVFVT